MKKILSLPLFVMPVVLLICFILTFSFHSDQLNLILFVVGIVAVCFHFVWSIFLMFVKDVSGMMILSSIINKILLIPVYVYILIFGIAYFIASPFIMVLTKSESMTVYGYLIAIFCIAFIYLLVCTNFITGVVKSYKSGKFSLSEMIIYIIFTFMGGVSFVVNIIALIRYIQVKSNNKVTSNQNEKNEEQI